MQRIAAAALILLLVAACREEYDERLPQEPALDPAAHRQEVMQWQMRRDERLRAGDGWLTLIGLHWLNEGENTLTLRSKTPMEPVRITMAAGAATLHAVPPMTVDGQPVSGPVALRNDNDEKGPTIVQAGSVRFNVIKRGPRYGLRVKDAQADTLTNFQGMDYFPIDPKWRVVARFEPYAPVKKIPIDDVTGMRSESDSPGALVFTLGGQELRLDPILETEDAEELFIIFSDETRKDSTYQAGRYIYVPRPGPDGKVVIDFNRAYNPPCVFTPYATCPLPPPQNRLPIRIEAGEKRYH